MKETCLRTAYSTEYRGSISMTRSGLPCANWAQLFKPLHQYIWHAHERGSALQSENYCRNPSGDKNGPWCYTNVDTEIMDYCEIPRCGRLIQLVRGIEIVLSYSIAIETIIENHSGTLEFLEYMRLKFE